MTTAITVMFDPTALTTTVRDELLPWLEAHDIRRLHERARGERWWEWQVSFAYVLPVDYSIQDAAQILLDGIKERVLRHGIESIVIPEAGLPVSSYQAGAANCYLCTVHSIATPMSTNAWKRAFLEESGRYGDDLESIWRACRRRLSGKTDPSN